MVLFGGVENFVNLLSIDIFICCVFDQATACVWSNHLFDILTSFSVKKKEKWKKWDIKLAAYKMTSSPSVSAHTHTHTQACTHTNTLLAKGKSLSLFNALK